MRYFTLTFKLRANFIRNAIFVGFFTLFSILIGSCRTSVVEDNDDTDPLPVIDFVLVGDYLNTERDNPSFTILQDQTHSSLNFSTFPELHTNDNFISIYMNMVSIYDNTKRYAIDSVFVNEYIIEEWVWFPEFSAGLNNITTLAVVLVLDVSLSLGDDFNNVIEYAKEFIDIVKDNNPNAKIGIVDFASEVHSLSLTTNGIEVKNYINDIIQGNYTSLYDAMAQGYSLVKDEDAEGKALVTFTDGRDNYSQMTVTELDSLLRDDPALTSFTLGLEGRGGVEEEILKDLAISGQYQLASSISDLQDTFRLFGNLVSDVYRVRYTRNDQIITEPRKIRFTFVPVE